ncbi:MAG: hypothetical protein ABJF10_23920 [Chthoniobacter sp.]|uniref:hypothetical protein n=1 Tax=Chthoniobacter sp. TaxID=2510640 RepID=UPI0032AAAF85
MPTYVQSGEFYGVSYITGPSHVFLQIAFSSVPVSKPSIVGLPATRALAQTTLDPQQICSAVVDAAATANAELGTTFFPAVIRYVPDDSPRYPLFSHCTILLIRRLASGEPFAPATNIA